jgi:predicted nucleic acid-binding protein
VAVVVFDADVLIAYLGREDAHHAKAVEQIAVPSNTRGADTVDAMFVRFGIETIQVDMALARRAAAVRARTRLKLPDAYALATAIHAEKRGHADVRLETLDEKVIEAYEALHPLSPDLG